jgi:predicted transcriptional regulator
MKKITLGSRELQVMKLIYNKKQTTVREVVDKLNQKDTVAYNTVQTVMGRLVDKGLLTKTRRGKTDHYSPAKNTQPAVTRAIQDKFTEFITQFTEDELVGFFDGLDNVSDETRKRLIEKLKRKL